MSRRSGSSARSRRCGRSGMSARSRLDGGRVRTGVRRPGARWRCRAHRNRRDDIHRRMQRLVGLRSRASHRRRLRGSARRVRSRRFREIAVPDDRQHDDSDRANAVGEELPCRLFRTRADLADVFISVARRRRRLGLRLRSGRSRLRCASALCSARFRFARAPHAAHGLRRIDGVDLVDLCLGGRRRREALRRNRDVAIRRATFRDLLLFLALLPTWLGHERVLLPETGARNALPPHRVRNGQARASPTSWDAYEQ